MNMSDREDSITLGILQTIDGHSDVSQRYIADRLDVALGLANLCLKRCVRKGLIKIRQAPANRYLYYLTPKGFAEKSRLTALYLSISFDLFRTAGRECAEIVVQCRSNGWKRLLLCGVSEVAEIAFLRASEARLNVIGAFDPESTTDRFLTLPVWKVYEQVPEHDACLIAALADPGSLYALVSRQLPEDRIFVPPLLRFSRAK